MQAIPQGNEVAMIPPEHRLTIADQQWCPVIPDVAEGVNDWSIRSCEGIEGVIDSRAARTVGLWTKVTFLVPRPR